MEMNRRALYNSLRMNWVLDPTLEVESWQVEDYRSLPLDVLFEKLEDLGIPLDKPSFLAFADIVETPEDLTEQLLVDTPEEEKFHDKVYLIVFELWRRLLPEKPCLSVFCDEIDHQIHIYDNGQVNNPEGIQDALANLQVILDENTDNGAKPIEAFDVIDSGCANDIESFLYDFIAEQIDNGNYVYATELLEGFGRFVRDVKWFELLRARLLEGTDPEEANRILKRLLEEKSAKNDLSLNLEVLSFLVRIGDQETFEKLAKRAAELVEVEEDFQNLVSICADFYHRLDRDRVEQALQGILNKRANCNLDQSFDRQDPHFAEFFKILAR